MQRTDSMIKKSARGKWAKLRVAKTLLVNLWKRRERDLLSLRNAEAKVVLSDRISGMWKLNSARTFQISTKNVRNLEEDPHIHSAIAPFWNVLQKASIDESLAEKEDVILLNIKLFLIMIPGSGVREARIAAENDWVVDTHSASAFMTKSQFFSSMLELGLTWGVAPTSQDVSAALIKLWRLLCGPYGTILSCRELSLRAWLLSDGAMDGKTASQLQEFDSKRSWWSEAGLGQYRAFLGSNGKEVGDGSVVHVSSDKGRYNSFACFLPVPLTNILTITLRPGGSLSFLYASQHAVLPTERDNQRSTFSKANNCSHIVIQPTKLTSPSLFDLSRIVAEELKISTAEPPSGETLQRRTVPPKEEPEKEESKKKRKKKKPAVKFSFEDGSSESSTESDTSSEEEEEEEKEAKPKRSRRRSAVGGELLAKEGEGLWFFSVFIPEEKRQLHAVKQLTSKKSFHQPEQQLTSLDSVKSLIKKESFRLRPRGAMTTLQVQRKLKETSRPEKFAVGAYTTPVRHLPLQGHVRQIVPSQRDSFLYFFLDAKTVHADVGVRVICPVAGVSILWKLIRIPPGAAVKYPTADYSGKCWSGVGKGSLDVFVCALDKTVGPGLYILGIWPEPAGERKEPSLLSSPRPSFRSSRSFALQKKQSFRKSADIASPELKPDVAKYPLSFSLRLQTGPLIHPFKMMITSKMAKDCDSSGVGPQLIARYRFLVQRTEAVQLELFCEDQSVNMFVSTTVTTPSARNYSWWCQHNVAAGRLSSSVTTMLLRVEDGQFREGPMFIGLWTMGDAKNTGRDPAAAVVYTQIRFLDDMHDLLLGEKLRDVVSSAISTPQRVSERLAPPQESFSKPLPVYPSPPPRQPRQTLSPQYSLPNSTVAERLQRVRRRSQTMATPLVIPESMAIPVKSESDSDSSDGEGDAQEAVNKFAKVLFGKEGKKSPMPDPLKVTLVPAEKLQEDPSPAKHSILSKSLRSLVLSTKFAAVKEVSKQYHQVKAKRQQQEKEAPQILSPRLQKGFARTMRRLESFRRNRAFVNREPSPPPLAEEKKKAPPKPMSGRGVVAKVKTVELSLDGGSEEQKEDQPAVKPQACPKENGFARSRLQVNRLRKRWITDHSEVLKKKEAIQSVAVVVPPRREKTVNPTMNPGKPNAKKKEEEVRIKQLPQKKPKHRRDSAPSLTLEGKGQTVPVQKLLQIWRDNNRPAKSAHRQRTAPEKENPRELLRALLRMRHDSDDGGSPPAEEDYDGGFGESRLPVHVPVSVRIRPKTSSVLMRGVKGERPATVQRSQGQATPETLQVGAEEPEPLPSVWFPVLDRELANDLGGRVTETLLQQLLHEVQREEGVRHSLF